MTIDRLGLYQRTLLGGLGGLLGWLCVSLFIPDSTSIWLTAVTGGVVGLAIGGLCGVWDGLFRERSTVRTLRGGGFGAGLGFVGGMLGLLIGQALYNWADGRGGLFPLAIGWAFFGAAVGVTEGLQRRMPQKMMFGAFGGLLGGLVGGSIYVLIPNIAGRGTGQVVGLAISLVLLGMAIGMLIGLVEDLLRSAWLMFTSGRFEGQTRTLDPGKPATTMGRSELDDICILGDPALVAGHVTFRPGGNTFHLEAGPAEVLAGQAGALSPVKTHTLRDGDFLQIGKQRARFVLAKSGKKS